MDLVHGLEVGWFVALVTALVAAMLSHRIGRKPGVAAPRVQSEIVDALSVYLCGNRDTGRLRALAKAHPHAVKDTIVQYQTIVYGRREELCELTFILGYVQNWWYDAQSANLTERLQAFASIASMAHYEPVRRVVGDLASKAFADPNEQIRLHAARVLLAGGEPADIVRVFQGAIADTPGVRSAIAAELGRFAPQLCESAIPKALRSQHQLNALKLLVSWERALPLPDVHVLAEHNDPAVRAELMRLLPYLPATQNNREAIFTGMADRDPEVRAAAAAADGKPDTTEVPTLHTRTIGVGDACAIGNPLPSPENA
jgi:hypothetical protein